MGATSLMSRRYYLEIRHHGPWIWKILCPFFQDFSRVLIVMVAAQKYHLGLGTLRSLILCIWIICPCLMWKKPFMLNLSVLSLIYGVTIRIHNMVRNLHPFRNVRVVSPLRFMTSLDTVTGYMYSIRHEFPEIELVLCSIRQQLVTSKIYVQLLCH